MQDIPDFLGQVGYSMPPLTYSAVAVSGMMDMPQLLMQHEKYWLDEKKYIKL